MSSFLTLQYCESVVKVVSISFHNRVFLPHVNPKCNNNCDNHVHKITFRIPPFHCPLLYSIRMHAHLIKLC